MNKSVLLLIFVVILNAFLNNHHNVSKISFVTIKANSLTTEIYIDDIKQCDEEILSIILRNVQEYKIILRIYHCYLNYLKNYYDKCMKKCRLSKLIYKCNQVKKKIEKNKLIYQNLLKDSSKWNKRLDYCLYCKSILNFYNLINENTLTNENNFSGLEANKDRAYTNKNLITSFYFKELFQTSLYFILNKNENYSNLKKSICKSNKKLCKCARSTYKSLLNEKQNYIEKVQNENNYSQRCLVFMRNGFGINEDEYSKEVKQDCIANMNILYSDLSTLKENQELNINLGFEED